MFTNLVRSDHVRRLRFATCCPKAYRFLSLKRFDPQFWLPSLTLVWGIVSICQGLVTNQAGLFGIRLCEPSSNSTTNLFAQNTEFHSTWYYRSVLVATDLEYVRFLLTLHGSYLEAGN